MLRIVVLLHICFVQLQQWSQKHPHNQRGSGTIEVIVWTAFLIALATGAFAVFRAYAEGKLGVLR